MWGYLHPSPGTDGDKECWNRQAVIQGLAEGWGNQARQHKEGKSTRSHSQWRATRKKNPIKQGREKPAHDLSSVISQTILQDQEGMEECWFLVFMFSSQVPAYTDWSKWHPLNIGVYLWKWRSEWTSWCTESIGTVPSICSVTALCGQI